ncbi:hypothetical protein A6B43_00975 [Vespertiliibacter pulmonis]|uniref:Periplasmic chaperone for outer membrane proteins Skp n=1 Tax=Vespertiliibacter pulmonis TaxID=1443036 RepID=A0A3N4VT25_9PAST|nr:OmpH family outer membrane protein [Vespertiliibacter pulmonis]QLB20212.1 hypothetical protein A6B43_00975 [Vespertiliibacter pulmonis]RPE86188.1 periplasmic chaperone for outer membrane proteins Skp [Vespertiliibacter pulmonis]
MKNVFKLAAVAAAFTFSANLANADDKIAFADPGYLLQNHPAMVAAAEKIEKTMADARGKFADEEKKLSAEDKALNDEYKKIETDAKKLQQEQSSVEASIKKKIAALEKDAPRLRSKEIQARQTAIQNEQKAFQGKVAAIQKREAAFKKKAETFQKKVAELQAKMQKAAQAENAVDTVEIQKKAVDDINAAIKTVADSKGYTIVLPAAALYVKDENANITEAILAEVKAKQPTVETKPANEKAADTPKIEDAAKSATTEQK